MDFATFQMCVFEETKFNTVTCLEYLLPHSPYRFKCILWYSTMES